jgi:hypothetical protein
MLKSLLVILSCFVVRIWRFSSHIHELTLKNTDIGAPVLQEEEKVWNKTDPSMIMMQQSNEAKKDITYALVVVACKAGMDWLLDVPKEWRVVVFEKCGPTIDASSMSLLSHVEFRPLENVASEECNGYLDYIIDLYHDLTDITVFMHDDGLIPYNKRTNPVEIHSPFHNFSQIVDATQRFLTPSNRSLDKRSMTLQRGFLHFGTKEIREKWGKDPYHGKAQQALWPFYATQENPKPPRILTYKPSANMAVRKERILLRPWDVYRGLKRHVYHSRHVMPGGIGDARQYCCAMERQWHMLFGEPPILPGNAMVTDLLKLTKCWYPGC